MASGPTKLHCVRSILAFLVVRQSHNDDALGLPGFGVGPPRHGQAGIPTSTRRCNFFPELRSQIERLIDA